MPCLRQLFRAILISAAVCTLLAAERPPVNAIRQYCVDCHDAEVKKGALDLEGILAEPVPKHAATWEKAVRKMQARQMPPVGKKRPDEAGYKATIAHLTK